MKHSAETIKELQSELEEANNEDWEISQVVRPGKYVVTIMTKDFELNVKIARLLAPLNKDIK